MYVYTCPVFCVNTKAFVYVYILCIQNDPRGKFNILGGHRIAHSKQKNCICTCVLFRTVSETELISMYGVLFIFIKATCVCVCTIILGLFSNSKNSLL
jgi:hypothetical protein